MTNNADYPQRHPQSPVDMSATSAGFDFLASDTGWSDHRPAGPPAHPQPTPPQSAPTGWQPPAQGSPRRGHATVVGQVRGIQQRTEGYGEHGFSVLTFRVERYDDAGNRLQPVSVQLRAPGYDGALSEGDEVRVAGRWKNGTLHTSRVDNLTTGASVAGKSVKKALLIFLALVAVMAIVFVVIFIRAGDAFQRGVDSDQREFQEQVDQQQREFCEQAKQNGVTPQGC